MKKSFLTKTMSIIVLMLTIILVACKPKPGPEPEGPGNNPESPSEPEPNGPSVPTSEGIYLGIVGFNKTVTYKEIELLNEQSLMEFKGFINQLTMENGTGLYYADYVALNKMKTYPEPPTLKTVALVTFTDGLDNVSLSESANPEGYANTTAYLNALNQKICNEEIYNNIVSAYTIGVKGSDVYDDDAFYNNLNKLASDPENVFEASDMNEALLNFYEIAESLQRQANAARLKLQIPGGYDDGQKIRFTFDNVESGDNSNKYVEATYVRTADGVNLENITYNGFSKSKHKLSYSAKIDGGIYYEFEFVLSHENGNTLTNADIQNIKLWRQISSGAWQPDAEFTTHSTQIVNDKSSALIMLVLDCTSSLGDQFGNMKLCAENFVQTLYATTSENENVTVKTNDVTNVTQTTAKCGGSVSYNGMDAIKERGVCWSTSKNPTVEGSHKTAGSGTGNFNVEIDGLNENTTYYVRAYAKNSLFAIYGEEKSFTTTAFGQASVNTNEVTDIKFTSAKCGGEVVSDGDLEVTARGVCWSTSLNPTIEDDKTENGRGLGKFTSNLTNLTENTTYYVRAYAINEKGISYGAQKRFTTEAISKPTVTTNDVEDIITDISVNSAKCGGNVISDGGATVTARGVCWSTSQNPTIEDNKTEDGNGLGTFTSNLTNLTENTTYYVRAYATNEKGTSYGEERSFTINSWVDLGLPSGLKWARYNIGAEKPEDYGDYFAWGETETKTKYTKYNSETYGMLYEELLSQGYIDENGNLTSQYDAATANWGEDWRMPTYDEIDELVDNCDWTWTTENGVNGYKVTGPNGNSIFLPAAGSRSSTEIYGAGVSGHYWSSDPHYYYVTISYSLYFYDDYYHVTDAYQRLEGYTIRPVRK